MNRNWIKQTFLDEQKKKKREKSPFQGHVPIVKQLEDMLKTHTVQPGETLWGIAQQNLQSGERWPDIRDLNIPVLKEGLSRFAPNDPRREKELGHWIFPGQEFRLPMQEEEPSGLQGAIQELLQRKYTDKQIRHGLEMPAKAPSFPQVEREDTAAAFPMLDPRQRGMGPEVQKYKWPITAKEAPKKPDIDIDTLTREYLDWRYVQRGETPTESALVNLAADIRKKPEHYHRMLYEVPEAPKNAFQKVANFTRRMSEIGAAAFTQTPPPMRHLPSTGNDAADMIADSIGGLLGYITPEGAPQAAFKFGEMVAWNIAPEIASRTKIPVGLLQKALGRGAGFGIIGGMGAKTAKDAPKEAAKGVGVGVFSGLAEHVAGPMMNSITRKFGIPAGTAAEKILEAIHRDGTSLAALNAGFGILEGKPAREVAQDAVVGYAFGGLLGGITQSYSEAKFRFSGRGFTMGPKSGDDIQNVIRQMRKDGWVEIAPGVYEHPNNPPGYHRTLNVEYQGKTYSLHRLMRQFGEVPKGTVLEPGEAVPGIPTRRPVEPAGLIEAKAGKEGPLVPVEPAPPKLPQAAYDLVVRTKNTLKKQYGRDLITWIEGGEKPPVPDGLGESEAKDMETKLIKIAEREGMAPTEEAPPAITAPPVATEKEKTEEALRPMAERSVIARNEFVNNVMEQFGFNKEEANAILDAYIKAKAVKLDWAGGRYNLKHGAFWERGPMEEALRQAKGEAAAPEATEPAPPEAKEPWQMTREELSKNMEGFGEDVGAWERDKPWTGEIPPVGTWRMDRATGALEQLRLVNVNEITPMEPEGEVMDREDYKQYVEWAKQGIQPPPITVVKGIESGNWLSVNRRRLMAAKEAGQETILAWASDTDMETSRPIPSHKDVVEQALAEGKPVPAEVLADYPELTPEPGEAKTEKPPAEKKEVPPEKPAETEKRELKPLKPLSEGNTVTAYTDNNDPIEVKYAISEAANLVTSHDTGLKVNPDYPEELQPRQRERAASELQVNRIANRLNPARLGENPMISDGAPVVGPDGVVETGNGRTIAIKRVYESKPDKAKLYKDWLVENADKFGIDPKSIEGAKQPILIRVRQTKVDRVAFTQEGNVATVAEMSAAEIATQDAKKLGPKVLSLFVPNEDGRIDSAANRSFISAFIADVVPSSERGKMMDAEGRAVTQDGIRRIRNAVFARVYGNALALEKLAEDTDVNVRNQVNSMVNAAPMLLEIKEGIKKGDYFPLDITEDIAAAMVKLSDLRDSKMPVDGYLKQMSLFGEELTNIGKAVLNIFDKHKRSAKRITSILQAYAHYVELAGSPNQVTIFQNNPPTKDDVLAQAVTKVESLYEGQLTVFKAQEVGNAGAGTPGETGTGKGKAGKTTGGTQKAVGPAPKLKTAPPSQSIPLTRRRDIVKFLSDKLDIPIRVGRYRQRARGIFKVRPEVVRTKLAQDIPIIAHEVGHYLDKRLDLSSTKAYDDELMALGQVTSKPSYSKKQVRAEGVAEFMRLYLTDPQDAIRQAPHYYAAFEQIMAANQDIHDVLLQARQDITNWISQPAKARVLGVLSVGEKSGRKMTLDRLYAAAVDELHPIKKYVDALFPEGVDFDEDPFMQAWLSRGWAGKAETLLNYGIVDKDYKKIGPSLKEILDPVKANLDDFRAYITAKRAIELHGRDIESGITLEDAEQVVKELETPEFIKAQKKLVGFSDALVDVLVDAQILDKAGADTFRAMNRNYVPFYRVFEEMGGSHGYGKTGYANLGNPVRRMKGSQRDIVDPLESIVRNAFFFTNVAERNNVGRLVVELAEFKEGAGKWVEKVPAPIRPVTFGLSEIKDALEGIGIDTDGLDLDNAATIFRPSPFPAGKENILAVWREGKREFYQVEPELYRALLSLDKESANLFVNLLSKPAALLRAGATLSPDFMVRNPIRDMWTALVYSKYGYKPADFIRGLFSVLKKDDLYWKFHASGAAHGAMVSLDRDYLQGSLRGMLQTSAKEKAKFLLTHPVEVLRALSEYGEMATRLGEFGRGVKAERKAGKGIRQAALSARDVTLDFARWGNVGKIPNRVIAFFNASIQSIDKMARAFRQKPGQSIPRCLLYITLPSIILYMMNRDDERYQELPQWEKDLFWIVLTPKHVFRIPKPFELGVIFGTLPERVLDYIYTEDPEAFKGYLNTVKEAGLPDILPTALTGWLEAFYANKSFFTDRPIVPVGEERLPAELQYGNYTSETAKLIGKYLHISPRKADHIAYSYGGGLARYGTKVLDQLLKAVGATEKVTKPASTLADYPVVGAFTSRVWSNSKSMDTLYTRLDEAEKAYSKRKAGRELTAKEQERLSNLGRYRSAASDMSELRLAGQRVFDDPRMTAEEKREKMDTINILRINIARRAIGLDPITVKP